MKSNFLINTAVSLLLLAIQILPSCAVNRVIYNEQLEIDGVQARIVLLSSQELSELVVSMQKPGDPIKERVFLINWMPEFLEIDNYNDDSNLDIKIISTDHEVHYFYGTEQAFIHSD